MHIIIFPALVLCTFGQPAPKPWETGAAVYPLIEYMDPDILQSVLIQANSAPAGSFTWRDRSLGIDQLLTRWDSRHPSEIFRSGFAPHVRPTESILQNPAPNSPIDLWSYVQQNIQSVFVSTTRGVTWRPYNVRSRFRYDIYAPGGIDVNPTLGPHQYSRQNGIAFVGGIDTRYILGALELNSEGEEFRNHRNPFYKSVMQFSIPVECPIPQVSYTTLTQVNQCYCSTSADSSHHEKKSINNNYDVVIRSDGGLSLESSHCYKVDVTAIYFDQPDETGLIENIDTYIVLNCGISVVMVKSHK